jgi:hypothetical protein
MKFLSFLLFISFAGFAQAGNLCRSNSELSIIAPMIQSQLLELDKIVQASTKKENLSKITIRHGTFGINVGGGDFFAKTAEGKLVSLNIDVTVGLFGMNETIKESISIDRLVKGEKLKFKMEGGSKDVLIVEPQTGFTALGGTVKIKIWDGSAYSSETISVKKVNGVFVAQKSGKKVVDLDIHMRGLSVANMYVGDYTISTK